MAETSHRSNPDREDVETASPHSFDEELRSPAEPKDLPGSRSEMLPREESDAVARMADDLPARRQIKPDETSFFGFPHPAPTTEPTLFDDSRSARSGQSIPGEEASGPDPSAWEEDEASLQERLRKWMADARMRQQAAAGPKEHPPENPSPGLPGHSEPQRTLNMGASGSDPTIAETPEALAKSVAARLQAAQPAVPEDPLATIMVPADQFLGARASGRSEPAPIPPRKLTREEALTRKIAILRRNAEAIEEAPARIPAAPEDNTLIAAAVALLAVIFVLGLGLFAATQAGMFDGLESRFEFLRPEVSAENVSVPTAAAGRGSEKRTPVPASGPPAGTGDRAMDASLLSAAKEDASNLLTLYAEFARRYPGLTGEVRMRLTIGTEGRILEGNVTSSTTGVAEFDEAVLLRVREWRLAGSPGSAPKIVTFPILFPLRGL